MLDLSGRIDARLSSLLRRVTWWDVSTRGAHTGRLAPSHLRCMVGCHGRAGHPSTGASLALLAVYAIVIPCFLRLVLRFLLAGLFLIRPILLSFRTRHGARFFP